MKNVVAWAMHMQYKMWSTRETNNMYSIGKLKIIKSCKQNINDNKDKN